MVIGYDAKRAFQNMTGLGNYSRMLICGLAKEHPQDRCFLYAPRMTGYYKGYFSNYANISTRQPTGLIRFFPDLWRRFDVGMHLQGDGVDIYHGLSHELPHGIGKDIKKVVTMHDLIVWRYPQFYKPIDRVIHRFKQRHSCRIADVVIAISEATKRDLIDFMHIPEEKIRVIYQSCDPIFWQPVSEQVRKEIREDYNLPEKYIICVGSIEERKNQIAVVKAMAHLPEDVHLAIVGKPHGSYHLELEKVIGETGMAQRVHILDDAGFDDFPALYAGAQASVYASLFEGFGIPILESMCCDTPVVTSNISSMPEAGGDAVLYADPSKPEEIAVQLNRILTEPGLREELVAKGCEQRERFAMPRIIEQFYRLYADLLPDTATEE